MLHNFLTADASTAAGSLGGMSSIIFLVIIFVVFYFFLIRPENKRKKKLTEMRNNISIGDEIVTIGGIMGKVVAGHRGHHHLRDRRGPRPSCRLPSGRYPPTCARRSSVPRRRPPPSAAKSKKNAAKTSGEENKIDEGKGE